MKLKRVPFEKPPVLMNIKLPIELRNDFLRLCRSKGTSTSLELREFMLKELEKANLSHKAEA